MGKIKAMFDPHNVADGLYPTGRVNPVSRVWPLLRRTVFKVPRLLRAMMLQMLRQTK